jgi:hypothetical protein
MDLYEVHVPCGQKVVVICKENGEDVKILKNGKPIYKENEETKKTNNGAGNLPRLVENGERPNVASTQNATSLPRLIENGPNPARGNTNQENQEEVESTPVAEEESETRVENNMAGGKKSRRNNARKNNATRRKAQAGGKRGPNGYMKFANKVRPQILKEHPELKSDVVGVARKIGEKWRALSDAEKKKY